MKFKPSILAARLWATVANYVAGPDAWNGQPTKANPVADFFTPGEHPAAEELNYLLNDRYSRLTEARTDLIALERIHEATSAAHVIQRAEQILGVATTAAGRTFRLAQTASAGTALALLGAEAHALPFSSLPSAGGNNLPTCVSANGERVLYGEDPDSYIYDVAGGTFSAAISAGVGITILEAQPISTGGWLAIWVNGAGFNSGIPTSVRGPRTYRAHPANTFEARTVSNAGVVGSDAGSSSLANAMTSGGFANNDYMHTAFVKKDDQSFFFLISSDTGQKRRGVYTTDQGASWSASTLPNPFPADDCTWTAEYSPISERLLLAVSNGVTTNVYRSTDMGANWILGNSGQRNSSSGASGSFSLYDMRRAASGVVYGIGYTFTSVLGAAYYPVYASIDGVAWHMVAVVNETGFGRPMLAMQDTPFVAFGGADSGAYYPRPGLAGFGLTNVSF